MNKPETARMVYEFGAHAGALEGYVYQWFRVDTAYLPRWTENLLKEYQSLPEDLRAELQDGVDGTLGRALISIQTNLGQDDAAAANLKPTVAGKLPTSPEDFELRGQAPPGSLRELYEFAANAGAFEGYVYFTDRVDYKALQPWADNLTRQFGALPEEFQAAIAESCRQTLGRAVQSLKPFLGDSDPVIRSLMSMIQGDLPQSPDDFVKH